MNELVVKDNALINASYSLSLTEQRLLLLAVVAARQNDKNIELSSLSSKPIQITADSYMTSFEVNRNTSYEALKNACKNLFERRFSYQERRKRGVVNITSRWVSQINYLEDAAAIEIIFAPAVIPLITKLEEHFTSYELEQVKDLTSAYAVRLYELLICWRSTGKTPQIPIQELRNKLGVLENDYNRMYDFKKNVLDFAISQINEFTNIKASYEQHKQGRKIVGFTFKFKIKKKNNIFLAQPKTQPKSDNKQDIEREKIINDFFSLSDDEKHDRIKNVIKENTEKPFSDSFKRYGNLIIEYDQAFFLAYKKIFIPEL